MKHMHKKPGKKVEAAAKGPKTPYDKYIGERQAYKITGEVKTVGKSK